MALWILFFPLFLYSALTEYLKPIENKTGPHQMPEIDFIYMINLDVRPEKWALSNQRLNPYGIFPHRFSAVNGWELSLEVINNVGLKFDSWMDGGFLGTSYLNPNLEPTHNILCNVGQTYFAHPMTRGVIGIVLSHLSVLRDALESRYDTIWVMEDDIEVVKDPRILSELIKKLDLLVGKGNWDVLFTDQNTRLLQTGEEVPAAGISKRPNFFPKSQAQYYIKQQVSEDFIQIGARFGAYSMILRQSGIQKIYNFIIEHSIFLPYDLDYYLPHDIKLYTVAENVVRHLINTPSDNRLPRYLIEAD